VSDRARPSESTLSDTAGNCGGRLSPLRLWALRNPGQDGRDDAIASRSVKLKRLGRHASDSLRNGAPDHRARPVQPRLHDFFSQAQAFPGFARAQSLDVSEHEHGAVVVRQRFHRGFEYASEFLGVRLTLRIRFR
jgi:hypothetical protein